MADADGHSCLLFGAQKLDVIKRMFECPDMVGGGIEVSVGGIGKRSVYAQQVFDA